MWGLAAASAYRAYNDSTSLGYAQATWDQVSVFQIQPSDAAKGFASAVNASIPSTCNGSMSSTSGANGLLTDLFLCCSNYGGRSIRSMFSAVTSHHRSSYINSIRSIQRSLGLRNGLQTWMARLLRAYFSLAKILAGAEPSAFVEHLSRTWNSPFESTIC